MIFRPLIHNKSFSALNPAVNDLDQAVGSECVAGFVSNDRHGAMMPVRQLFQDIFHILA